MIPARGPFASFCLQTMVAAGLVKSRQPWQGRQAGGRHTGRRQLDGSPDGRLDQIWGVLLGTWAGATDQKASKNPNSQAKFGE